MVLTLLGSTALAMKWYLYMARTHWQIEVQAFETLAIEAGMKSSLSMYGWIALIIESGMLSWKIRKKYKSLGGWNLLETCIII